MLLLVVVVLVMIVSTSRWFLLLLLCIFLSSLFLSLSYYLHHIRPLIPIKISQHFISNNPPTPHTDLQERNLEAEELDLENRKLQDELLSKETELLHLERGNDQLFQEIEDQIQGICLDMFLPLHYFIILALSFLLSICLSPC